jgi:hypothetical protein
MNPSTDIPLAITLGVDDASDPSLGDGDLSVLPNNNQGTHPDVLTLDGIDARAKEMNKSKISLEDVQFLSRAMPLLEGRNGSDCVHCIVYANIVMLYANTIENTVDILKCCSNCRNSLSQ